jgi:hypothetical protein
MFFTPVYIFAILLSAQFGLKEVAISYVFVNFIFSIIYISYIIKKINLSFFKIFKNIKNALINNILLTIYYCIFLYFDFYNLDVISWYFQLMILISGVFIYLLLQFIFPTHAFNYFFQFLMLNKLHISINNFLNRFFKFKNNLK